MPTAKEPEPENPPPPSFINAVNTLGLNILSYAFSSNSNETVGVCAMRIYHFLSMAVAGDRGDNITVFAKVSDFMPDSEQIDINDLNTAARPRQKMWR
jgi:hypothetical protein